MSEQNTNTKKKSKGKLIAIISIAVILIAAIVAGAIVLVTRNSEDKGPTDADGNPIYPSASDVTSVEYLHRGGLDSDISIESYELEDEEGIADFIAQLKAIELRDPTDEDRAAVDYTADVEMFTLKTSGNDVVLLIMGDTISINNDYGSYFYITDGFDMDTLTKSFDEMDIAAKLAE